MNSTQAKRYGDYIDLVWWTILHTPTHFGSNVFMTFAIKKVRFVSCAWIAQCMKKTACLEAAQSHRTVFIVMPPHRQWQPDFTSNKWCHGSFQRFVGPKGECEWESDRMPSALIENKGGPPVLSCCPPLSVSQQQESCLPNPAAEFLLCSRPFGAPRLYERGVLGPSCCPCARCLTLPPWVTQTLKLYKSAFSSLSFDLGRGAQRAFFSCDSED